MKNIKYLIIIGILVCITYISCTDNARARTFGGKEVVQLKSNEKLINVTWKNNNMWLLTQDTLTSEFFFREKSSWNVFEGEISFK